MNKKAKCPYTRKPCMGEDCELWETYPVEEKSERTGQKVVKEHSMCTFNWQTKIAFDNASFTDYMGKSLDSFRNESTKRQDALLKLAHRRQIDVRKQSGNGSRGQELQEIEGLPNPNREEYAR